MIWFPESDKSTKIQKRCIDLGEYLIEYKCSIRQLALEFCMSKSQVHRDLLELRYIDDDLYVQCRRILLKHKKR